MIRRTKRAISALFFIGAFFIIEPNCLNLITTKAYAEEKPHLKSIYLNDGNRILISKDEYSYVVDVDKDTDKILIKPKPEDTSDEIRVNGQVVTSDDNYREILTLNTGKNKVEVEVEDDKTKSISTYTVYIYRGEKNTAYLEDININDSNIGFKESTYSYNIELDEGTDIVELQTVLEEGNYTITANGTVLGKTNSIKVKFNGIGKYTINIGVLDNDTKRIGTYTLNLYLGIPVTPNVSDSINAVLKPNQWVIVNGRWRYNDALGKCLKNTWFYDNKYKSYFHFNNRGNMQTGWINDGGNWYYLNSNGVMQTGWINYENEWYFLDGNGVMRTGWAEYAGKWYFLGSDGTITTGWTYLGDRWYFLDRSGAMKIGWIYYGGKWYYLNSDGTMQTGWLKCNDEWYFLNPDGTMKSGEWLYSKGNWYYLNYVGNMRCGWLYKHDKYYYFSEDGAMRINPITIDGYKYKFNSDGSVDFG